MVGVDIIEDMKKVEVTSKSVCNIFFLSRSGIQSTQNRFKLIKFDENRIGQAGKTIGYEDVIADIANIPVVQDDNRLLYKNNVKYT